MKVNNKNIIRQFVVFAAVILMGIAIALSFTACSGQGNVEGKVKEIVNVYAEERKSEYESKEGYSNFKVESVSWAAQRTKSDYSLKILDCESTNSSELRVGGGITYFIKCSISVDSNSDTNGTSDELYIKDYIVYDEATDRLIYFFKAPWKDKTYTDTSYGYARELPLGSRINNIISNINALSVLNNYDKSNIWVGEYSLGQ